NVGTGIETDVNQLFSEVHRSLGAGSPAIHGKAMPGEQLRSSISSAKLREHLGVSPDTTFADGIRETAAWFKKAGKPGG
ncbi:MAG: UDP-glucose 4-epimerase, partial [Acidobacteriota bacterium]